MIEHQYTSAGYDNWQTRWNKYVATNKEAAENSKK